MRKTEEAKYCSVKKSGEWQRHKKSVEDSVEAVFMQLIRFIIKNLVIAIKRGSEPVISANKNTRYIEALF